MIVCPDLPCSSGRCSCQLDYQLEINSEVKSNLHFYHFRSRCSAMCPATSGFGISTRWLRAAWVEQLQPCPWICPEGGKYTNPSSQQNWPHESPDGTDRVRQREWEPRGLPFHTWPRCHQWRDCSPVLPGFFFERGARHLPHHRQHPGQRKHSQDETEHRGVVCFHHWRHHWQSEPGGGDQRHAWGTSHLCGNSHRKRHRPKHPDEASNGRPGCHL